MTKRGKGKKDSGATAQETGHYRRYPEEEIIDALEENDSGTRRAGKELEEHFRAVTGKTGRTSGRKD